MAITDLTGTTWVWSDEFWDNSFIQAGDKFYVNFVSNSTNFTNISYDIGDVPELYYNYTWAANGTGGWEDPAYQTISITGGTDATNSTLISWLEANATQQGASQVTVDMSTLTGWASLSAGTHTLTVVAKATGYIDSDPSTGVQFSKTGPLDAPYIELD